jgi:Reverse transcriptase (RNA-dependent DNA polymerase)
MPMGGGQAAAASQGVSAHSVDARGATGPADRNGSTLESRRDSAGIANAASPPPFAAPPSTSVQWLDRPVMPFPVVPGADAMARPFAESALMARLSNATGVDTAVSPVFGYSDGVPAVARPPALCYGMHALPAVRPYGVLGDDASAPPPKRTCYGVPSAKAFAAVAADALFTPTTYSAAVNCPQAERWRRALDDEYGSLLGNNTWVLVPREPGMKVIPSKWVFKIKLDADNQPIRYKCRLVAGGHRQQYGIDFEDTFAPVSKHTTLRAFLSTAAHKRWKVLQLDISTAFLHGNIDAEVYMQQPEGFEQGDNLVCKLTRCLYGLKQAPRAWFAKLTDFLLEINFQQSIADPNLWFGHVDNVKVFIVIVVDDTLIHSSAER